jgi:hypothetical protein
VICALPPLTLKMGPVAPPAVVILLPEGAEKTELVPPPSAKLVSEIPVVVVLVLVTVEKVS